MCHHCVVMSLTIVSIILLPRGHVHRSRCGFCILSDSNWSSSSRNSLTSSATYKQRWMCFHCVVMSLTIVSIILLPQGQVHRSRFYILFDNNWSSSSRNSLTSSATYKQRWMCFHCVVMSLTIVSIILLPRGHVHRSRCGFCILSDSNWSSSSRNSLTSSATYKQRWMCFHCVVMSLTIVSIILLPQGQIHRSRFCILFDNNWSSFSRNSLTNSATYKQRWMCFHCVVMSLTIVSIILLPQGQVHRSRWGFCILSDNNWSSSSRNSLTSSANYKQRWMCFHCIVMNFTIVSINLLPLGQEHRSRCGFFILPDNSLWSSSCNSLYSSATYKWMVLNSFMLKKNMKLSNTVLCTAVSVWLFSNFANLKFHTLGHCWL